MKWRHASNREGKTHYSELGPRPKCGKYDGERKESVNIVGRYFVRCASCGCIVDGADSLSGATRKRNRAGMKKQEGTK